MWKLKYTTIIQRIWDMKTELYSLGRLLHFWNGKCKAGNGKLNIVTRRL
jgi:hypothetical protein